MVRNGMTIIILWGRAIYFVIYNYILDMTARRIWITATSNDFVYITIQRQCGQAIYANLTSAFAFRLANYCKIEYYWSQLKYRSYCVDVWVRKVESLTVINFDLFAVLGLQFRKLLSVILGNNSLLVFNHVTTLKNP